MARIFLLALLMPGLVYALPSARLVGADAPVRVRPAFQLSLGQEPPTSMKLVDPETMPSGLGKMITGAILGTAGVGLLAIGLPILIFQGSTPSSLLGVRDGSIFLIAGAIISALGLVGVGVGVPLIFIGRGERIRYNAASEAWERQQQANPPSVHTSDVIFQTRFAF